MIRLLRKKSAVITKMELLTTAWVVDRPTPSVPREYAIPHSTRSSR